MYLHYSKRAAVFSLKTYITVDFEQKFFKTIAYISVETYAPIAISVTAPLVTTTVGSRKAEATPAIGEP